MNSPKIKPLHTETLYHLQDIPKPTMLVEDLIPVRSLTILAGEAYSGKTFKALEIARAVAFGKKAFGKFPARRGNVLMLALDSPKYDTGRALWAMLSSTALSLPGPDNPGDMWDKPEDAFRIAWHPRIDLKIPMDARRVIETANAMVTPIGMKRYWDPIDEEWVEDAESMGGCELIVIDTFRRSHTAQENDSGEMQQVMSAVDEIREKTKSAVILIHHASKADLEGMGVRGSTAIEGSADNIFRISGSKPTTFTDARGTVTQNTSKVRVKKARAIAPEEFQYHIQTWETKEFDEETGVEKDVLHKRVVHGGSLEGGPGVERGVRKREEIVEFVEKKGGEASRKEIVEWGEKVGISESALSRHLPRLERAKALEKIHKGREVLYRKVDENE